MSLKKGNNARGGRDLFTRERKGRRLTSLSTDKGGLRVASINVHGPEIHNYDLEVQFEGVVAEINLKMREGNLDRFYYRWRHAYESVQFNMQVRLDKSNDESFLHEAPTHVQQPPPADFDAFVRFGVRDYFAQLKKRKYVRKATVYEIAVRFMSLQSKMPEHFTPQQVQSRKGEYPKWLR